MAHAKIATEQEAVEAITAIRPRKTRGKLGVLTKPPRRV